MDLTKRTLRLGIEIVLLSLYVCSSNGSLLGSAWVAGLVCQVLLCLGQLYLPLLSPVRLCRVDVTPQPPGASQDEFLRLCAVLGDSWSLRTSLLSDVQTCESVGHLQSQVEPV